MIVAAVLLLQAFAAPTLEEVMRLPPAAAGELVLQGQQHGRIVAVAEHMPYGLRPPDTVELHLIEASVATDRGCSRVRWTARFRHASGESLKRATLVRVYNEPEVALAGAAGCPSNGYARLALGISAEEGFSVLALLDRVRSGTGQAQFACSDESTSRLCESDATIAAALNALPALSVTRSDGRLELRLGTPGNVVTKLRLGAAGSDVVEIRRIVLAPS